MWGISVNSSGLGGTVPSWHEALVLIVQVQKNKAIIIDSSICVCDCTVCVYLLSRLKCLVYSTSKMSTVKNVSWFVVNIPEGKPDICWTQLNSISEHECSNLSGWTRCLDTINRFINTCLWWVNLTTARLVCLQVIPFKGNFYHQMFQPNAGLPRKRKQYAAPSFFTNIYVHVGEYMYCICGNTYTIFIMSAQITGPWCQLEVC